jgi:transcriptional regulator with XRE-family HTH domain
MAGNRIAFLREIQGLKPVDIASRIGVSENTALRWERGVVQIPDERKLQLAALFDVSVGFLMGWPETNDKNGERQEIA